LSKRWVRLPIGVLESLAGGKSKPPDMAVGERKHTQTKRDNYRVDVMNQVSNGVTTA
jgi:hypothetical protein